AHARAKPGSPRRQLAPGKSTEPRAKLYQSVLRAWAPNVMDHAPSGLLSPFLGGREYRAANGAGVYRRILSINIPPPRGLVALPEKPPAIGLQLGPRGRASHKTEIDLNKDRSEHLLLFSQLVTK